MSENIIVFRGRRVRIPGDSASIEESIMRVEALMETTDAPMKRRAYKAVRDRLMARLAAALWDENAVYDTGTYNTMQRTRKEGMAE